MPFEIRVKISLSGSASDILSAYSGNSLLGAEIAKRAASVDFLMCGHTHMPVLERTIHGIPCLNVGADYGVFRGVIYDTDSKAIKWVGQPVAKGTGNAEATSKTKLGWWELPRIIIDSIPESEILAAMPKELHPAWDKFMFGQGAPIMDNGECGIYARDFFRFLRSQKIR